MKSLSLSLIAVTFALVMGLTVGAHSQAPADAQTSLQRLQEISRRNKQLIETQTTAIKKLEDLEQLSQQLKFMGRRT